MNNYSSPLPSTPGIYQIVNNINQKRYIGYASNLGMRVRGHLHDLVHRKHPNDYLQKAWNKYGRYNFSFKILQECKKEELCLIEDYWVKILKVNDSEYGYNLKPTDPTGRPGQSQETIEKIRKKNKGKPMSEVSRKALVEYWQTHPVLEEHKEKRRQSLKSINWKKIKGRTMKRVFDWNSNIIYESAAEAARATNVSRFYLCKKLAGTRTNNTDLTYI